MARVSPEIREAAEQVIETLTQHPGFVAYVAKTEIDRQIAEGTLVPAERLQIGPGLTLTPIGALDDYRNAISEAVKLLEDGKTDEAIAVLTFDTAPPPTQPVETEPDPEPVSEPEPQPEPEKPDYMPKETEPARCQYLLDHGLPCNKLVEDRKFAELMAIRWREVRCKEHGSV